MCHSETLLTRISRSKEKQLWEDECLQCLLKHCGTQMSKVACMTTHPCVTPLCNTSSLRMWQKNIYKDQPNGKNNGRLSCACIARESANITCMLAGIQRQAEKCESFIVKKRTASSLPWLEATGMKKLQASYLEVGHPMWLVTGVYLSFSGWS